LHTASKKKAHKNEETLKIRNCQQIKKIQNSRTEKKKNTAIKKTPSQKITFLISLFFSAFRSEKKKKKKKNASRGRGVKGREANTAFAGSASESVAAACCRRPDPPECDAWRHADRTRRRRRDSAPETPRFPRKKQVRCSLLLLFSFCAHAV
jgi:hypothetical protein